MRKIYIGYLSDDENERGVSVAGNKFQKGFLREFTKIHSDMKILNIRPKGAYPKNKRLIFKKSQSNIDGLIIQNIAFINIYILKELSIFINIFIALLKELKENECEIITYNYNAYIAVPMFFLSKFYKIKKICLLIDTPSELSNEKISFRVVFKYILIKLSFNLIKKYDLVISLSNAKNIKELKKVKRLSIDCGINEEIIEKLDNIIYKKKEGVKKEFKLVFTGTLNDHSGILNLIKGMEKVKSQNIKLYIYGKGKYEKIIKEYVLNSKNIIFGGYLYGDELYEILKSADLLVNPSDVENELNKAAFPSKILEYLVSSKPVITSDLECFSKELKKHMYFFSEYTSNGIAKSIEKISQIDEQNLEKKGKKARDYIKKYKTWSVLIKDIQKFIEEN